MPIQKTLRPVRANKGIELAYRRRLVDLIDRMHRSVLWFIGAEYKRNQSRITTDALPSRALADKLNRVMARWRKEFNNDAEHWADVWAQRAAWYVGGSVTSAARDAGITVRLRLTRQEQDALRSLIIENTNLIKSIPEQYLTQVQGLVQRSVQSGRDIAFLSRELEKRYEITKRRAIMIAKDQNNKATEQLARERYKAMGVTQAIWIHTPIGKTYRHSHVAMNGKVFDLNEGMYDPEVGYNIFPGELVNCYCEQRAVIPELAN